MMSRSSSGATVHYRSVSRDSSASPPIQIPTEMSHTKAPPPVPPQVANVALNKSGSARAQPGGPLTGPPAPPPTSRPPPTDAMASSSGAPGTPNKRPPPPVNRPLATVGSEHALLSVSGRPVVVPPPRRASTPLQQASPHTGAATPNSAINNSVSTANNSTIYEAGTTAGILANYAFPISRGGSVASSFSQKPPQDATPAAKVGGTAASLTALPIGVTSSGTVPQPAATVGQGNASAPVGGAASPPKNMLTANQLGVAGSGSPSSPNGGMRRLTKVAHSRTVSAISNRNATNLTVPADMTDISIAATALNMSSVPNSAVQQSLHVPEAAVHANMTAPPSGGSRAASATQPPSASTMPQPPSSAPRSRTNSVVRINVEEPTAKDMTTADGSSQPSFLAFPSRGGSITHHSSGSSASSSASAPSAAYIPEEAAPTHQPPTPASTASLGMQSRSASSLGFQPMAAWAKKADSAPPVVPKADPPRSASKGANANPLRSSSTTSSIPMAITSNNTPIVQGLPPTKGLVTARTSNASSTSNLFAPVSMVDHGRGPGTVVTSEGGSFTFVVQTPRVSVVAANAGYAPAGNGMHIVGGTPPAGKGHVSSGMPSRPTQKAPVAAVSNSRGTSASDDRMMASAARRDTALASRDESVHTAAPAPHGRLSHTQRYPPPHELMGASSDTCMGVDDTVGGMMMRPLRIPKGAGKAVSPQPQPQGTTPPSVGRQQKLEEYLAQHARHHLLPNGRPRSPPLRVPPVLDVPVGSSPRSYGMGPMIGVGYGMYSPVKQGRGESLDTFGVVSPESVVSSRYNPSGFHATSPSGRGGMGGYANHFYQQGAHNISGEAVSSGHVPWDQLQLSALTEETMTSPVKQHHSRTAIYNHNATQMQQQERVGQQEQTGWDGPRRSPPLTPTTPTGQPTAVSNAESDAPTMGSPPMVSEDVAYTLQVKTEEAEDHKELLRLQLRAAGDHLARLTRMYNMLNEHNDGIEDEYMRIRSVLDTLRFGVARSLREDIRQLQLDHQAMRDGAASQLSAFYGDMQSMMLQLASATTAYSGQRQALLGKALRAAASVGGTDAPADSSLCGSTSKHLTKGGKSVNMIGFAPMDVSRGSSTDGSPSPQKGAACSTCGARGDGAHSTTRRRMKDKGASPSKRDQSRRTNPRRSRSSDASSNNSSRSGSFFAVLEDDASTIHNDSDEKAKGGKGSITTAADKEVGTSASMKASVGVVTFDKHGNPSLQRSSCSPEGSPVFEAIDGDSGEEFARNPTANSRVSVQHTGPLPMNQQQLREYIDHVAHDLAQQLTSDKCERLKRKRRDLKKAFKLLSNELVVLRREAHDLGQQLRRRDEDFALYLRDVKRSYNEQLRTCEVHIKMLMDSLFGGGDGLGLPPRHSAPPSAPSSVHVFQQQQTMPPTNGGSRSNSAYTRKPSASSNAPDDDDYAVSNRVGNNAAAGNNRSYAASSMGGFGGSGDPFWAQRPHNASSAALNTSSLASTAFASKLTNATLQQATMQLLNGIADARQDLLLGNGVSPSAKGPKKGGPTSYLPMHHSVVEGAVGGGGHAKRSRSNLSTVHSVANASSVGVSSGAPHSYNHHRHSNITPISHVRAYGGSTKPAISGGTRPDVLRQGSWAEQLLAEHGQRVPAVVVQHHADPAMDMTGIISETSGVSEGGVGGGVRGTDAADKALGVVYLRKRSSMGPNAFSPQTGFKRGDDSAPLLQGDTDTLRDYQQQRAAAQRPFADLASYSSEGDDITTDSDDSGDNSRRYAESSRTPQRGVLTGHRAGNHDGGYSPASGGPTPGRADLYTFGRGAGRVDIHDGTPRIDGGLEGGYGRRHEVHYGAGVAASLSPQARTPQAALASRSASTVLPAAPAAEAGPTKAGANGEVKGVSSKRRSASKEGSAGTVPRASSTNSARQGYAAAVGSNKLFRKAGTSLADLGPLPAKAPPAAAPKKKPMR